MKKIVALVVGLIIIIGGATAFVLSRKDDSPSVASSTSEMHTDEHQDHDDVLAHLTAQTVGQDADCSHYSFDDLGSIWGVTFTDTDTGRVTELNAEGGKLYTCGYNETNSGTGVTVDIEYREYASEASAKQSINDTRSTEKYGDTVYYDKEELSGIGDEAFLWAKHVTDGSKLANRQMYVRKGSVVFLLSTVNLDGVDATANNKLQSTYKLHFD